MRNSFQIQNGFLFFETCFLSRIYGNVRLAIVFKLCNDIVYLQLENAGMCCSMWRTIGGIGAPSCAQLRLGCTCSSTLSSAKSLRRLRLRSVCRPSQRSYPYFSLLLRSRTYHAFQYACLFGPIGTHSLATVYQTPCTVILFPQKANAT